MLRSTDVARAILVPAALTVGLAACGARGQPAGGPAGEATATGRPAEVATQTWPASKVPADTFVSAGLIDPTTLDPAHVYETSGEGLDMNLYDSLVAFKREQPNEFAPALATEWAVSADGLTYTFKLRPGVRFHEGGTLEAHDAAYSIQRVMLSDVSGGPSWLYLKPILGVTSMKDLVLEQASRTVPAGEEAPAMAELPADARLAACEAVQAAVVADDAAGTVTIQLKAPTPWFTQLVATWLGSVQDQEWMAEQGAWDGTCARWTEWYDQPLEKSVLYDRANGTGPYRLGTWKKKEALTLDANEGYWRTEPAWENGPAGPPRLKHVVLQHVPEWGARYAKTQGGEADTLFVPGTEIDQVEPMVAAEYLAGDDDAPATPVHEDGILNLYRSFPTVNGGAINFDFRLATEGGNEFIGSGILDGEGIPPDFFSDVHVRKGFNYCFDWDIYIREVIHGDGVQMRGPIIEGLQGFQPDSPIYTRDLQRCEDELAQAWGGQLPETGFRVTVPYAEGWTDAQAALDILADGLAQVNPKYKLDLVQMEWPSMLDNMNRHRLPMTMLGWIEDYHDASNWTQAYLYDGASRGWPADLAQRIDGLITAGLAETDSDKRDAIYVQLQQIAHDEALAIYLYQGLGRAYLRREVQGWYANPLVPATLYYTLNKSAE